MNKKLTPHEISKLNKLLDEVSYFAGMIHTITDAKVQTKIATAMQDNIEEIKRIVTPVESSLDFYE